VLASPEPQETLRTYVQLYLRVRERKHPKLYWVDPGVARAAKAAYGPLIPEERPGRTEDGIELWPIATLLEALQTDSRWP
jgi:hypothetical protein